MKRLVLNTKNLPLSRWKEFQEMLVEQGLSCEIEWYQNKFLTVKPCKLQEANSVKISFTNDEQKKIHIITTLRGDTYVNLNKCNEQQEKIILQTLSFLKIASAPSFKIGIVLSLIHYALLIIVFCIAAANMRYSDAPAYMVLCSFSFVFITIGIYQLRRSVRKGYASKLARFLWFLGCITTVPSSALQTVLMTTYIKQASFSYLAQYKE